MLPRGGDHDGWLPTAPAQRISLCCSNTVKIIHRMGPKQKAKRKREDGAKDQEEDVEQEMHDVPALPHVVRSVPKHVAA